MPLARIAHVPFVVPPLATEHASHDPPHAVLQQNPSTQFPVAHWLLAVHAVPCVSFAAHWLEPLQ